MSSLLLLPIAMRHKINTKVIAFLLACITSFSLMLGVEVSAKGNKNVEYIKAKDGTSISAETIAGYDNSANVADGAKIEFDRIEEITVSGLVKDSRDAGKKNLSEIESVMSWISNHNSDDGILYKVVIPKGVYYIDCAYSKKNTRCIHLYSNTWLSMKGVTLVKKDRKSQAFIRGGRKGSGGSEYNGVHNVIIEGGTVDVDAEKFGSGVHFTVARFGHARNIIISNVEFKGAVSGHHLELCGVKDVSILGCTFSDYVDTGHVKGINRNEALQLDITHNSTVSPTFQPYDDTTTQNVVVYKNKFVNLSRGVGSHSAVYGKYYDGIAIEGNAFKDIKSQAIYCQNYINCSVSKNKIQECGGGIDVNCVSKYPDGNYYLPHKGMPNYDELKSVDANVLIRKNKVSLNPETVVGNASGIYVHGGDAPGYNKNIQMDGVEISDNSVNGTHGAGIHVLHADNINVAGNNISTIAPNELSNGTGILLQSCKLGYVESNNVKNVNGAGIELAASNGTNNDLFYVVRNNIDQAKGKSDGLKIRQSSYVDVNQNSITTKGCPVRIKNSSHLTVGGCGKDNVLFTTGNYGIVAEGDKSSDINAQYNIIAAAIAPVSSSDGINPNCNDILFESPEAEQAENEGNNLASVEETEIVTLPAINELKEVPILEVSKETTPGEDEPDVDEYSLIDK